MKRFNHYCWLLVYMYDFMCVNPNTVTEDNYFQATR